VASRAQRRAARRQQQQQGQSQGSLSQRARARQAQVRPAAQQAKAQTGRRESAQRARFIRESWAELKKVEWPNQTQVVTGTAVVVIACAIVGSYLWINDLVWQRVVQWILGQ
jgi:preprotein translocase SecE subunit